MRNYDISHSFFYSNTYKVYSLYFFMINKNKLKDRIKYYKNHEKRILYQREYDKTHKEIKRRYDKLRREKLNKNKIRCLQSRSRIRNFPILLKQFSGCQLCNSINNLEIHHIRYTDKLNDCMLLCQLCHKKIHRKPLI
jgi:hypothetical protein